MDRQITRNHAISGIELTDVIKNAILQKKLPSKFFFMPEVGARLAHLPTKDAMYEWGMMFRESKTYPTDEAFAFVVPSFSLFSTDINNQTDRPLIVQLIESQDLAPDQYLFEAIFEPLLTCYFELLLNTALQLECHAQNALIGFDHRCRVAGIIFRDLESVDKDLSLAKDLNIPILFKSCPYKCLRRSDYNYTIMHSFMYDFKLGEYLMTPLIDAVTRYLKVNTEALIGEIRGLARRFIVRLPQTFFPQGKWFLYENVVHDRTKPRPYIERPFPKYR